VRQREDVERQEDPATAADVAGQIYQMAGAHMASRLLYAAVRYDIPDRLAGGPRTSDELADDAGLHRTSLYRVLRALATMGVFAQEGRRFSLTPVSEMLVSGHVSAARELVLTGSGPEAWDAWGQLPRAMETGEPAADLALGKPYFEYIAEHPDFEAMFGRCMTAVHGAEPTAVVAAYDFSGVGRLVDVGGGIGNMLSAILQANANASGVLFDSPAVVERARIALGRAGVADRCEFVGGDFFEHVPEGGDTYVLSHVIHDWDDESAVAILSAVRRAMGAQANLLIVEAVVPESDEPHPSKVFDVNMLVFQHGGERTRSEYGELLGRAGLRPGRLVPTASMASVLEALPG
jgi:O-methyltransferase domain